MKATCYRVLTIAFGLLFTGPVFAGEFDAHIFDAHVKACHDSVWAQKEFENIPNAGISAYIGGYNDDSFYAYWIVDWDNVQVAGKCLMERKKPVIKDIQKFVK